MRTIKPFLLALALFLCVMGEAVAQTSMEFDGHTSLRLFSTGVVRDNVVYQHVDTVTVCTSQLPFRWHGQKYLHTGRYSWLSTNGDSVATLILTVLKPYEKHFTRTICGSLTQMGFDRPAMMMKDGSFALADTLEARNGCDSIIVWHLKVDSVRNTTEEATVKRDRLPYLWHGKRLKESGTYTWTGRSSCGCDSVVTLMLNVEEEDFEYDEDGMFYLSPSMARGGEQVKVVLNLPLSEREGLTLELMSQDGKILARRTVSQGKGIYVTMPERHGLYIVRLTTVSGRVYHGKGFVK